ncbi:hypothetical protein [Afipia clevelandensis]|uniref:hypothetical protein n=1 Tax=Afipia clevelandensis TaxID=1034 RepID=UPI0012F6447F|nr:hypothetical protein [Afipia clevelandensis]
MFGWLRKRQLLEHRKLLAQNFLASSHGGMRFHFTHVNDVATIEKLSSMEENARRIAIEFEETGSISQAYVKSMLEMNLELRRIFDVYSSNSGEAKVRAAMGQPALRPDFDKSFRPHLAWDS